METQSLEPPARQRFESLPKDYAGLVAVLPPRPIHDEGQFEEHLAMAHTLAGFDLTPDQDDYLEALSIFLEAYENVHHPLERGC